jgi:flagellar biosynthesis protein FlhF
MTVKTLTGPSIQDALAQAREEFGDDVVLMESTPASEDGPAKIAVAVDPPVADTETAATSRGSVPKPSGNGGSMAVPDSGSEDKGASSGLGEDGMHTTESGDGESGFSSGLAGSGDSSDDDLPTSQDFGEVLEREQGPGRGQIFSNSEGEGRDRGAGADRADQSRDRSFEREANHRSGFRSVNEKRWSQHPLYEVLREKGLKSDTVTRLFNELSERGVDPTSKFPGELRWACAKLLFQRIEVLGPDRGRDNLMLVGPGGAGKTSLLLKMATHDRLLVGGKPMVIHLEPASGRVTDYQNPTSLYERFGVPVRNVRTKEDLGQAMRHTERFGRVLIDTPPLPLPLKEGRPILRRVQSILRPLRPLNIHFTLNATRALDNLDATILPHLPVRPTAVAMTHLDEVSTWGRLIEWLITVNLPIQFVSGGSDVPDGARAFSLEWFVENVMDL